jgi:hypothetical protein
MTASLNHYHALTMNVPVGSIVTAPELCIKLYVDLVIRRRRQLSTRRRDVTGDVESRGV